MKWFWLAAALIIGGLIGANSTVANWFPTGWSITLEGADHFSQILLLVVASLALVYAFHQVKAAHAANRQSLNIGWATLLLELDGRWEGHELRTARVEIQKMVEKLTDIVGLNNPRLGDDHKKQMLGEEFTKLLNDLQETDISNYSTIMRVCGFFETVGVMVEKNYIPLNEIDRLFRGPILTIDTCFRPHIEERQKETGVPSGMYEHALSLADKIKQQNVPG